MIVGVIESAMKDLMIHLMIEHTRETCAEHNTERNKYILVRHMPTFMETEPKGDSIIYDDNTREQSRFCQALW